MNANLKEYLPWLLGGLLCLSCCAMPVAAVVGLGAFGVWIAGEIIDNAPPAPAAVIIIPGKKAVFLPPLN